MPEKGSIQNHGEKTLTQKAVEGFGLDYPDDVKNSLRFWIKRVLNSGQ
jgi:hypothetical protein